MFKKTIFLFIIFCFFSSSLLAYSGQYRADFPLEIINIKPSGTGDPAIGEENRIFWAYPGIEYNIRPAVLGGEYPYTFSLSNAPEGMDIDQYTGEITWPNPQSDVSNITVTVTDSQGNSAEATWSITVTDSTDRFIFVDDSYSGTETGSISQPYSSISNLRSAESGNADKIVYFRNGTYYFFKVDSQVTEWDKNSMNWDDHPKIWLKYPGETVKLDCQDYFIEVYQNNVKNNIYFDGFEIYNITAGFMYSPFDYLTIRRCTFHDGQGISSKNKNYGFIYLSPHSTTRYYSVFQNNEFYDFTGMAAIGSIYKTTKMLIEDNYIHDSHDGIISLPTLATKHNLERCTIRHNRFVNLSNCVTGHSTNGMWSESTNNIICFNLMNTSSNFGVMGSDQDSTYYYIYRNTFMGGVAHNHLCPDAWEQPLGPYYYDYNIFQNDEAGIEYKWDCCGETVDEKDNLKSTSGIVDSSGNLTDEYSEYLGSHGWEIANGETSTDQTSLPEPKELQVID